MSQLCICPGHIFTPVARFTGDIHEGLHQTRLAPFLQVGNVIIGCDLDISDLYSLKPWMRYELEIGYDPSTQTSLDGFPNRLPTADLEDAVDVYIGFGQSLLECQARCRTFLAKDEIMPP